MVLIFCSTPPHWGPDVCVTMSIIYPCIQYSQTFFCFFCALFLIHEKALKPLFFNENRAWNHAPSQVYAYYIVIFFTKFSGTFSPSNFSLKASLMILMIKSACLSVFAKKRVFGIYSQTGSLSGNSLS